MSKIIEIEITKLKDSFDIRSTLNQEHILYLWSLIDGGVELPPILVTPDFNIIDGRHRRAAYEAAGRNIVKIQIIETDGTINIVKRALQENIGGALPPTKLDLYRTMKILVEKKYSKQRIIDEFKSILPLGLIRLSYQHALWKITNKKVNEAIDLIRKSNITVEKAGGLLDINPEKIRIKLKGIKTDGNGDPQIKGSLSQTYSHFNKSVGKIVSKLFQDYEDGKALKSDTDANFKYLAKLISNQNRMYADWQKRWIYKK